LAYEFGCEAFEQAEHVVGHQHLAITAGAGADADGGDGKLARDQRRQAGRNRFEHQAETTGLLQQAGILQQALGGGGSAPLGAEPPQLVGALWGEPQVAHHRDAGLYDEAHSFQALAAALQLDGVHASLL
jgi:hypothetical protein